MLERFKQIALLLLGNIYLPPKEIVLDALFKLSIAVRLWLVLITVPLLATFLSCIFMIWGIEVKDISSIWSNFYFYGEILEVEAWRIHLSILFTLSLACLTTKD